MTRYDVNRGMSSNEFRLALAEVAHDIGVFKKQVCTHEAKHCLVDLVAQARLLTKIALDECNGVPKKPGSREMEWTERHQDAADEARRIAEHQVYNDCKVIFGNDMEGAEIEFNADPRGVPVKLIFGERTMLIDGGHQ